MNRFTLAASIALAVIAAACASNPEAMIAEAVKRCQATPTPTTCAAGTEGAQQ